MNSYPLLVAARGLTGIGAGTLMVLAMTTGALACDPNRMYATITFGQLASGAAVLYALPALSADGRGLRGVFYLCALLGVLGLLWARPFAALGNRAAVPRRRGLAISRSDLWSTMLAISFALVFNTVIGGLWAFAGEYTTDAAISPERIAQVLTYSTLVGLAGAAIAFGIGGRLAHRSLLSIGFLAILLGSSLLHLVRGDAGFAAGCYVLSFGWNFSVPFIFAAVAAQDTSGRAVPSMNLAFAFGLAIGPLLAGAVVEFDGLGALVPCMLFGLAVGTALMLRVTRRSAPR